MKKRTQQKVLKERNTKKWWKCSEMWQRCTRYTTCTRCTRKSKQKGKHRRRNGRKEEQKMTRSGEEVEHVSCLIQRPSYPWYHLIGPHDHSPISIRHHFLSHHLSYPVLQLSCPLRTSEWARDPHRAVLAVSLILVIQLLLYPWKEPCTW